MSHADAVIIETGATPTHTIIWLHGLGADGHDFESIVPEITLPKDVVVRFIFPHAPVQPITLNGGMAMRAWYDILGLDRTSEQDAQGIRQSERLIQQFIAEQIEQGIASERIFIAGFSQGGAMALHTGLRYGKSLAGIIALSTYLPLADAVADERHAANRHTPIFIAHGEFDPVLPLEFAQVSRDVLVSLGHAIDWHTYPMAHSVCPEEIAQLSQWLGSRLS